MTVTAERNASKADLDAKVAAFQQGPLVAEEEERAELPDLPLNEEFNFAAPPPRPVALPPTPPDEPVPCEIQENDGFAPVNNFDLLLADLEASYRYPLEPLYAFDFN